jgi:hypothetical protein
MVITINKIYIKISDNINIYSFKHALYVFLVIKLKV